MILVIAFGAVSEIVLPLLFAAVLAVIFKPLVGSLERRGLKPTLGAGLVVLGLLALMAVVVVATVRGVIQQTDGIGDSVDAAIEKAVDELDVDEEALEDAKAAAEETSPAVAEGFVTKIVSGVDAVIGLASGLILGALIMYYLLKDGTSIRRSVVRQSRAVDQGRGRQLPHRRVSDPPQLRTGSHCDVRDRVGGRRHRQLPDGSSARLHDRRRELHRRLHPIHRRVPRRWARGDHRLR